MAKKFLVKKPKDIGKTVMNAGIRGGAAVGTMWAAEKIASNEKIKIKPEYIGPIMMAAGIAGEIYIADPTARSAAQGVSAAASILVAGDFVFKDDKAKIGLSGLGQVQTDNAPIPADVLDLDFDRALDEAQEIQAAQDFTTEEPETDYENQFLEGVEEFEAMPSFL